MEYLIVSRGYVAAEAIILEMVPIPIMRANLSTKLVYSTTSSGK
jgi:hypothetical protein